MSCFVLVCFLYFWDRTSAWVIWGWVCFGGWCAFCCGYVGWVADAWHSQCRLADVAERYKRPATMAVASGAGEESRCKRGVKLLT